MANKKSNMTPDELLELACEKFYKVYDFDKNTKASDKKWIRVGVFPGGFTAEIRWNFFDGERLISDEPFDKAEPFHDGTSVVTRNKKYNVLRDNGTLVFKEWYHHISDTPNGKYIVEVVEDEYGLKRKEAFADADGNIISDWYQNILPMLHGHLYNVSKSTGPGVLDRIQAVFDSDRMEIVSEWYDDVCLFMGKTKYCRIRKGNLYNVIGEDCKPMFGLWSSKPIVVDEKGNCQLFDQAGGAFNASLVTRQVTEI